MQGSSDVAHDTSMGAANEFGGDVDGLVFSQFDQSMALVRSYHYDFVKKVADTGLDTARGSRRSR